MLKEEKLPYLRYKFVTVNINGKRFGTYALEEHFSKLLVENSGFREGPILKISEDFLSLDSFDINLLAKYYAINDILQTHHAGYFDNIRFYLSPESSKLIPIGFEGISPIRNPKRSVSIDLNRFGIFSDDDFVAKYVKELERLTEPKYLENFLEKIEPELKQNLLAINKSFPHVRYLKDELFKNLSYVKYRLSPINPLAIHLQESGLTNDQVKLKLLNFSRFPIRVVNIATKDGHYKPLNQSLIPPSDNIKRASFLYQNFIKDDAIKINSSELKVNEIKVDYVLIGSQRIQSMKMIPVPFYPSTSSSDQLIKREANYKEFEFIESNESNKTLSIRAGEWIIDRPLILPSEYTLNVSEGVTFKLKDKGILIAQGPINLLGSSQSPIEFIGINGGQGLTVLNATRRSTLSYVNFTDLRAPSELSIALTGAINFYNSPVDISNCNFLNSISEDSLNLFRSDFSMIGAKFEGTFSDALDIDFSDGSINDSMFVDVGNDGIDISGSRVNINNVSIDNAGDKAVSVGEKSFLLSDNLKISNSAIGIASKDLSKSKFIDLSVNNVKLCMVAFQKKPEYGPGSIELIRKKKITSCNSYLLEIGSDIYSDGVPLSPNSSNVEDRLYGNEYGKKTIR